MEDGCFRVSMFNCKKYVVSICCPTENSILFLLGKQCRGELQCMDQINRVKKSRQATTYDYVLSYIRDKDYTQTGIFYGMGMGLTKEK